VAKLALIVSTLCLTAVPALAGASQGGVSRLYQSRCYPGVGCWPLGYDPPISGYDPAWLVFRRRSIATARRTDEAARSERR
jgi:hypothetical protein